MEDKCVKEKIEEVIQENLIFINCGTILFFLSMICLRLFFNNRHTLTSLLTMMMCLLLFCMLLGGICYIIYGNISKERQLKREGNIHSCSVKLYVFFSLVFLAVVAYALTVIDAISQFIGAQNK